MEYRIIEMGYENIGFYPENKREDCIVWRSLKEENMVGFGYKTIEEAEERRDEIIDEIFQLNIEEVHNEAAEELSHQISKAIRIYETEYEE